MTLRVAEELEQCGAKGLCLENVASLYDNLLDMYIRHKCPDTHIGIVMSPWPKQGGMAGDVFWPKEGYEVCTLSLRMRENGCLYCRASIPLVLAFQIFI